MSRQRTQAVSRRQFLGRASLTLAALPALGFGTGSLTGCAPSGNAVPRASQPGTPSEPDPKSLSWKTKIVTDEEPGDPLVVTGRIFAADGKTPLEGVVLYFYHTDARGIYSETDGSGGPPNPRLKGWVKTNAEGRYEFRTIKPVSYPNSRNPAHIHVKASGGALAEPWHGEFWFEGDPFLSREQVERSKAAGQFSPVMAVRRESDGVLHCTGDIKLNVN